MRLTRDMWCRAGKWIGICLTAMAFGWIALAQAVSTTTVQGTVYLANGQPGSGTLQLSWPAFTTSNNLAVAAGRTTVSIGSDGFVSVNLAPNLGSSPAGLYYTAVYHMSDGTTSTEYWVVPAAAQSSIASVRAQVMPAAQAVQAVNKAYVDQAIESLATGSLSPVGGTLTNPLYLNGDPSQPLQAADKHYVDETYSAAVPLSGGNMVGALAAPSVTASVNKVLLVTAAPYNAKCDGVTDDQAAIQAAFNDAYANGYSVEFPAGTCLTSTIVMSGQSFFGHGKYVTSIVGRPGQDVFQTPDPSTNPRFLQSAHIHDLNIQVDASVDASASAAGGNNTFPYRVTGTAGGLTPLQQAPAPGPMIFGSSVGCGGQIIADSAGALDEFYLPCATFSSINHVVLNGAPISIYNASGALVMTTTIASLIDDTHLKLKASAGSAQSNLSGTYLNPITPPWYVGNCGMAFPLADGKQNGGIPGALIGWVFENVAFSQTGTNQAQTGHSCGIFMQANNYSINYEHVDTANLYGGILEALPYQNVAYVTWTPDTTKYFDVNLSHHILPLVTYNGAHRVLDGVSIYGGAWNSPQGMGAWMLSASTGSSAGLTAYLANASITRFYFECAGFLSGEVERFTGQSVTLTGGSTTQCGTANPGSWMTPAYLNWNVSDGSLDAQVGGYLQINGDHNTLTHTDLTLGEVTDNGFENRVQTGINVSDPNMKRAFYANLDMPQDPVGKLNGDFLLNGNSASPFVSGSDLLTTCRDYRVLTSMCVNDPNGMELVKSYIRAPATGGTVSGISTGSVAVWNYLMVAGSRIPLAPVYVVTQGRCEGASSCSSLFIVRDRVTGNTIGSCNYTFGSSWTIQGGPTTSPCLVNFSNVPAGDAVGWDTNSWTASGLTAVDISFVGFQPQSTDLVNEVVASGQLASLSTANAQAFAGPLNVPSVNVTGNVAASGVNGYIYANRYATGGAGTPASPWTSASGTGGIQEAINAAPVVSGNAAASTVYIPTGYYAITAGITITNPVNLMCAGWNSVLYVAPSVSATTDIISVTPGSGAQIKGMKISDCAITPVSGTPGRYGIRLDGTSNEIQQVVLEHNTIQLGNGNAAVYATGSGAAQGTPVLTTIEKNILIGGFTCTACGDSVVIRGNQLAGSGTTNISFQTGATGFIFEANNTTNNGGTHIGSGNTFAPKFINNEFEAQTSFTGSNSCLLDFDGGSIIGGTIWNNTFNNASAKAAACAVRLNNVSAGSGAYGAGVSLAANSFTRGPVSGSQDITITANASNVRVGDNAWLSGGALGSMVSDSGSHDVLFFPFNNGASATGPTLQYSEPLASMQSDGTTYPLINTLANDQVTYYGWAGTPMFGSITGSTFAYNGNNGQIVAVFSSAASSSPGSSTYLSAYNVSLVSGGKLSLGTVLNIDGNGVKHESGSAPTASAGTITGTNAGGYVASLSAATSLTLTFANSGWTTWASCTANSSATATQPYVSAISKTAVTFTFPSLTGTLYYQPVQRKLRSRAGGRGAAACQGALSRHAALAIGEMGMGTAGGVSGTPGRVWFPWPEEIDREELIRFGRILDRRPVSLSGLTVSMALAQMMLRVRTRDGKTEPLRVNAVQRAFELQHGQRNIVLKARQMGLTTWSAARFFLKTITQPGTLTLEVAHTQEAAEEIFRIVHRFVDCLPEALREGPLKTSRETVRRITFPEMDSQYMVVSAGERNAGRGLTVQNLHCSELARWPGNAGDTLAGLCAALSPEGELILESTPDGVGGCFYEEWMKAAETGTVRHFFPWWMEKRYRAKAVDAASLTDEERALVERERLDLEQIGFRRHLRSTFRGLARQEYAEDAESCFRASGDSVFELSAVEARLRTAPAALEVRRNGQLSVWLPPLKGKQYLVAVDPAGGGSEGDYSAAQVVELESGLQCAEFAGHVGGQELAQLITKLAAEYNNAWLVVERNNHGSGVLALAEVVCRYQRIYRQGGQAGWLTNSVSRPAVLGRLDAALVEKPECFQSRALLAECRSFVRQPDGSTGARAGTHDDRVMAMAIALAARAELMGSKGVRGF